MLANSRVAITVTAIKFDCLHQISHALIRVIRNLNVWLSGLYVTKKYKDKNWKQNRY